MEDTAKDQDIVRTVIHADGSYAFFRDETEAANYAVQQHATLDRLMTEQRARELVKLTAPRYFGGIRVTPADTSGLDWGADAA